MKRLRLEQILLLGLAVFFGQAMAQGGPPADNVIDGELYPKGYTPMEIKNGVYPRDYYPNTEKIGPNEMRVTALGTGMPNVITGNQKASGWYVEGRRTGFPIEGGKVIAHEFDFRTEGVIFEENGVKISSFPAIHVLDGSVSFRLDWNGLSFVFGGDSYPNKWFVKHAKGADLVVHECFFTPESLAELLGTPYPQAVFITSYIHTPPQAFGKVMSAVKPRHAIGYHFWTWHDVYSETWDAVRETYDGSLTLASDFTVWNVTKEQIVVREAIVTEDVAPTGTTQAYRMAEREPPSVAKDWISPDINAGKWEGYTPPPLPKQ